MKICPNDYKSIFHDQFSPLFLNVFINEWSNTVYLLLSHALHSSLMPIFSSKDKVKYMITCPHITMNAYFRDAKPIIIMKCSNTVGILSPTLFSSIFRSKNEGKYLKTCPKMIMNAHFMNITSTLFQWQHSIWSIAIDLLSLAMHYLSWVSINRSKDKWIYKHMPQITIDTYLSAIPPIIAIVFKGIY